MKKFLVVILALSMALSLCACGSGQDTSAPSNNEQPTEASNPTTSGKSDNSKIEVDEGLLTVEVTMPASFFKEKTEEEIKAAADENGFISCTVNADGSVTYKMTKAKHKEMLAELKSSLDESIADMINGKDAVESFQKIEYADDFSKFDVYVDSATYTTFDNLYVLAFYISGAYYQAFDGKDMTKADVVVNIIDSATNETLNTTSYREWVESMAKSETESAS